jgi:protein-tyrosine-phosphatase
MSFRLERLRPTELRHRAMRSRSRSTGCDLSAHRARQLRDEDVKRADLICTMTQSQADVLRDRYPGR